MAPFAGWEMPLQYEGPVAEHLAVRATAGAFDVSHMGEIECAGPAALALLERVSSNDVARIEIGGTVSTRVRLESGLTDVRLELPATPGVAYLAGEARTIQMLRRHLVAERGWPRQAIRTKPFWAPGKTGMD